jgi:hypothetical protein
MEYYKKIGIEESEQYDVVLDKIIKFIDNKKLDNYTNINEIKLSILLGMLNQVTFD